MTVSNSFKKGGLRWMPDADAVNAPEGVLLRAQNLVPDEVGALSLRRGSVKTYSSLGTNVHTLYTAELADGVTHAMAGVDDSVYINGTLQASGLAGSGDIAVNDDSRQMFFARGSSRKKWDGTTLNEWSIPRPTGKVSLSAVASINTTIADFNNSESPAVTVEEGSGAAGDTTDQDGSANEATSVTPANSTSRGVLQRLWTSDQNFFTIGGVEGSETDLVDFYLKFSNVRNVDSVTVVFGVDDSSTIPFKDNRFEFTFFPNDNIPIKLKDPVAEGYAAYEESVVKSVSGVLPADVTGIQSPYAVKELLKNVGSTPSPKSNAPGDNVWSHLTITRGQFERIGNDDGRGWSTVRGFKIIVNAKKGKSVTMSVSDAIIVGGGDRTLTGTYRAVLVAVRQYEDDSGNIIYYERSIASDQSDPVNLNHQTMQVTVNGTTLSSLDPQVDQLWLYLFGGWLDAYYRFAVLPAQVPSGMTIDELTTPAGSDLNEVPERSRIPSWGFSYSQLNGGGVPQGSSSSDIVLTLRTSEMEALIANERLPQYQIVIPDNIIDISASWRNRLFLLTTEGFVYPTTKLSPSSVNSLQVVNLSRFGDPLWIAKAGNGVYVGMERDVIFLRGSGEDLENGARIDLIDEPLNVGNPPIDGCHWVEGNSIIYRSADGLMELTGGSVKPVNMSGISLLWRGQDRHGISALNITSGRFRCAIDNGILYVLAPEGENTYARTIYRFSYPMQQWSRLLFGQLTTGFQSIFNAPNGDLVAGDSAGNVWTLETGTQDNSNDINIDVLCPVDDGGNPLAYKDPFDVQLHCNTGGQTINLSIALDDDDENATDYNVSAAGDLIWRANVSGLGKYVKSQMHLTGTLSEFTLSSMNMSYRVRPQRMLFFDTGSVVAPGNGDVVWPQEVELDCISDSSTITMKVYANDVLKHTDTISPTVSVRDVHQVPLPRGLKGERMRVTFEVDSNETTGAVGFDPYMVRMRLTGSGNQDVSRQYLPMYPAGQVA